MATAADTVSPPASIFVETKDIPWKPTKYAGVEVKVLHEDKETGLFTALFKWAPGSVFPMHEHVDIEQTFVLEGSLDDEEGSCTAGNFVWRPAGSAHVATAPKGALLLAFLMKPNRFFE
jgi:anti-sigma factor ChrR (cupin superfamily)